MPHVRPGKRLPELGLLLVPLLLACTSSTSVTSMSGDASSVHDGGGLRKDGSSSTPKGEGGSSAGEGGIDAPKAPGNTASGLAAGGTVSTSTHYQFVGTLGQTPSGNAVSGSGRLNGGVVAATQQQP